MSEKIKTFKKFALSSTISTYLLIFIGGLVRVSGAGLGCPDWPKCFGRWIPPLTRDHLPLEFNAATFNFTLAWIEYINRLAGMITGFLILITAILAIKNFRKNKQILIPAILAAVFVAFQGWYGSIVVKSQLSPLAISIHMLIALIVVSLLIYLTYNAFHLERSKSGRTSVIPRKFLLYIWIITIIQILIGTETRSKIEVLLDHFPLLMSQEVLVRVGPVHNIHTLLGMVLAIGIGLVSIKILKLKPLTDTLTQSVWIMNALIILQIFIGFSLQIFGISPILQVFHLWVGSLFIGVVLILYTELRYQQV